MKFVNYKVLLMGDTITIPLDRPCKCDIGLADIWIPEIRSRDDEFNNAIDITCDQVDSSFDNPERLLRRIPFGKIKPKKYYQTWTADHIHMYTVDSNDKFLTIKIRRTSNQKVLFYPIQEDRQLFLTLAFTNIDAPDSWTTYI